MLPNFMHLIEGVKDEVVYKLDFIAKVKQTYDETNPKTAYFLSIAENCYWLSITRHNGRFSIHH